jgi:eukaryotic-like serine/threonine-protein kinase
MSPDRERQILDLVTVALEQPPDSRAAFLMERVGNDRLIRAEARSLLEFQTRSGTLESTRTLRGFTSGELVGGRFRIIRLIGSGGMGDVYEAEDTAHSRRRCVALKTIRAEIATDGNLLEQFEREIEIGQTITHPNVCRVYDLGFHEEREHGGGSASSSPRTMFVTMELLEGPTLAERLRNRGPMDTAEALPVLMQLAEALHAAHQANIVHRDFKPGNVMLVQGRGSTGPRAVVTDFGLAVETSAVGGTTAPAGLAGTPDYMSPEQVRGERLDAASDIYALGVVAYQMTTGHMPFDGETSLIRMVKRVHERPVAPSQRLEGFDPKWEAAILKCLERDPASRYATALEFVRALQPEAPRPAEAKTRRYVLPVILAVLLAGIGWLLGEGLTLWMDPLPAEKRVAVLRFDEIGGTGDHAFCDGLMERLTSKLAQLEQFQGTLSVIPASEIRREKVTSARDARREFNANLVIAGSVQRTVDGVRLIVNVVDTKTLKLVRSTDLFVPQTDAAAMQTGVIATVASLLEIQLHPEARSRLAEGDTAVPGAYDYYLQGAGYLRAGRTGVEQAISLFDRALKLDATYALANAGMGEAYAMKYRITKDPQWMGEAWKQCQRALELNPRSVQAHITMAGLNLLTGRYEEAIGAARAALAIDPASDQAYTELARAFNASKRPEEAEATLKKAIELRPGNWNNYAKLGRFYAGRSRYREAEQSYLRVIELVPDNPTGYTNLGGIYHWLGREDEAEQMFRRSMELRPTPEAASNLATAYFFQRRYGEAIPILEKVTAEGSRDHRIWGNLGDAYRWTPGMAAKAPEAYRRAIELANQAVAVNPRDAPALSAIALYRVKVGEIGAARAAMNRALQAASGDHSVVFAAAIVYAITGETEQSLSYLAEALRGGYSRNEIAGEPELQKLRDLPQYRELMKESGKEP